MRFLPIVILIYLFSVSSCKVDNTQKIFDDIELSNENHSFAFMLASNQNYFSTQAQENHFNALFNGNVSGINANKVHGFVLFPDASGLLASETAKDIKALYDNQGSNVFLFYPEVFENMFDHGVLYGNWKNAIKATINNTSAICDIGVKTDNFGKNINIYVKSKVNTNVDSTINACVYLVNKQIIAAQDTSLSDSDPNYIHYNVLKSSLSTSSFGEPCQAHSMGAINKNTFTYSVPDGTNRTNLKFVVVLYEMNNGIPKKVLNCRTIEPL